MDWTWKPISQPIRLVALCGGVFLVVGSPLLACGGGSEAADAGLPDADAARVDGSPGVDAAVDAATVDAEPGPRFPLRPSDDGRTLEDARGEPFLIHGEAAWSLLVQLTLEQAQGYLDDRASRGFNTLLVNLIEHYFADDPPRNTYGDDPFTTAGDFATPNEAYFQVVDQVLDETASREMLVLLCPAYLGWGGGAEGWFVEMSALPVSTCGDFGRWLGDRYGARTNLLWVAGGDYNPPAGSAGEACALAVTQGIEERAPGTLWTYHGARGSDSFDQAAFASWMDVSSVYTADLVVEPCLAARAHPGPVPAYLIEAYYEPSIGPAEVRRQAWWADLSCGAGQVFGNHAIWAFDAGWEAALDSPGAHHLAALRAFLDAVPWHLLTPSTELVVTGGGNPDSVDYVAAAVSDDGNTAALYVPSTGGGPRTLEVDLSGFSGSVQARYFDPTDGTWQDAAGAPFPAGGVQELTTPGVNADGDGDWALVLQGD